MDMPVVFTYRSELGQRLEKFFFAGDGFPEGGLVIAQGVFPARGVKALEQGLFVGIQKDDLNRDPGFLKASVDLLEIRQLAGQIAGVDAYGHLVEPAGFGLARRFPGEGEEQADGQIVDAIETEVFQHVKRRTLTRSGSATDDNQLHDQITSTAMTVIRLRRSCAHIGFWHPRIVAGDHRTTAH